jgi:hypothetical protein
MVETLALIPAFSPKEKENRSPVFWNVVRWRLQERRRTNGKRPMASPLRGERVKGEGGR